MGKSKLSSLQELSILKDNFSISEENNKEKKMNAVPNIGWKFHKAYYYDVSSNMMKNEKEQADYFKKRNEDLLGITFSAGKIIPSSEIEHFFVLKTVYPGLLIGSGISHETNLKGEMKLGFSFDYTTGLPYIPASSIKGVLRSVFPNSYLKGGEKYKQSRISYIRSLLEKYEKIDVNALEKEIFDGEGAKSIYDRDIIFDAVITKVNNKDKRLLGSDNITPHYKNILQNPIPIMFVKVLPNVEFKFRFKLNDGQIMAQDKAQLFKAILLDIGIGAKTNVGYGQFEDINSTSNTFC